MNQKLDYVRIDNLGGERYGIVVQCSVHGVARKFSRGESAEVTVRTLRELADTLERYTCESSGPTPAEQK